MGPAAAPLAAAGTLLFDVNCGAREHRHILMVAPLYPAVSGPGAAAAMRARGLAHGLRRLGHDVTVICAMPKGVEPDRSGDVEVIATKWLDLESFAKARGMKTTLVKPKIGGGKARHTVLRNLAARALPDRYATWVPYGARAIKRRLEPETILWSTGPRSSHIATRVALGGHQWVADLNDIWAMNPHHQRRFFRDFWEKHLEQATIGHASRLTTVNDVAADELRRRFTMPVTTIMSGYNEAEYNGRPPTHDGGPPHILFAGTLYRTLDLQPLLEVLREGKAEGWLNAETLRLSFVGRLSERVEIEADELGVGDLVSASGLIPRDELLTSLVSADALLLPIYEIDPYAMPMRFFEYVGAARPIIGYGPADRIQAKFIRDGNFGVVVSDRDEIKSALRRFVADPTSLPAPAGAARAEYTWARSIEKLDALVSGLTRAD